MVTENAGHAADDITIETLEGIATERVGPRHADQVIDAAGVQPDPQLVTWERPPDHRHSKATIVKATLMACPRRWAKIAQVDPGPTFLPWYSPLLADPQVEHRWVNTGPAGLFPPRTLYARYTGPDIEEGP